MHRIFLNYRTPLFLLLLSFVICQSMAYAGVVSVFGPRTFIRKTGKPFIESASFTVKNPDVPYTLKIYNGGVNSECSRVSSAVITLNGTPVYSPSDFNQQVYILQKLVTVAADNQLQVELRSIPGSCLSIILEGAGNTPPVANAGAGPDGICSPDRYAGRQQFNRCRREPLNIQVVSNLRASWKPGGHIK